MPITKALIILRLTNERIPLRCDQGQHRWHLNTGQRWVLLGSP
jgi:hypothetical protein